MRRKRIAYVGGLFPVRIRAGHYIYFANIPHDFTAAEAKKVSKIIESLVNEPPTANQE